MTHIFCCDWGTSSFRLYFVRQSDRSVVAHHQAPIGIKEVDRQWRASNEPNRTRFFRDKLATHLREFSETLSENTDGLTVLLSGMASSSIGMNELPYGDLPLSLETPNIPFDHIQADDTCPWPIILLSGIASADDVMRGEEIQLLGMSGVLPDKDLIVLLPGTHSKHLYLRSRQMEGFKTWMTGELFEVIQSSTILSSSLGPFEDANSTDSFLEGVRDSGKQEWLHTLFTIRARQVLNGSDGDRISRSYLSGLLIGCELEGLPGPDSMDVVVSGAPALEPLYRTALQERGYRIVSLDLPDPLTVAGQLHWLDLNSDLLD
ncbi:MAG: 2-dehydro-3-deoxygalactonokinase [Balneolaceae bacterium]